MPNRRDIPLVFPFEGLNERLAYDRQPPLSTPDCANVRPESSLRTRSRGGNRPGLSLAYADKLSGVSDSPVRMISSVRTASLPGTSTFFEDPFSDAQLGAVWDNTTYDFGSGAVPLGRPYNEQGIYPGLALWDSTQSIDFSGVVRDFIFDFDESLPYSVNLGLVPIPQIMATPTAYYGQFKIWLRLGTVISVPTTDSIEILLAMSSVGDVHAYGVNIRSFVGGFGTLLASDTGTDGTGPNAEPGVFRVVHNGPTITVFWKGNQILDTVLDGPTDAALTGQRVGFGIDVLEGDATDIRINAVDYFRWGYSPDQDPADQDRTFLVASANGNLWAEDQAGGGLEQITDPAGTPTDLSINDDRLIHAAERLGTLYIADHGDEKANAGDGQFISTTELQSASLDFSTLGIDIEDDVVVITNSIPDNVPPNAEGDLDGTYEIASISGVTGNITIASTLVDTGTCSFRVERGPKKYDPTTQTLSLYLADSSVGSSRTNQVPVGNPLIALWRDRIVLGGKPRQVWYMSRQGAPEDFAYFTDSAGTLDISDRGRAIVASSTEAGVVGKPLTAIIPHTRDYLIFATLSELYVMRGDPAAGGVQELLSPTVGVVGRGAWCLGPAGELWFLSRDGLYRLAPGASAVPEKKSKERMPARLVDIDDGHTNDFTVNMAYDVDFEGVHIYVTRNQTASGESRHFWYDTRFDSFWPVELFTSDDVFSIFRYESDATDGAAVLLGARSGFLNKYYRNFPSDGGTPKASHLALGPFLVGSDPDIEGRVNKLVMALAENSAPLDYDIYVGNTAEEAYNKYNSDTSIETGTVVASLNKTIRPQVKGYAFIVKLSSTATGGFWAMERFHAELIDSGVQRLL